ncbi:restriction endonuclease subunit S [Prevotella jejuni]|jgi:hypothetical protein|uniref:restriction endonuclease subunit S n=1 Tax=Prevotella jejuni TaxID=1177574 RepID=UPI001BA6588F|nr:restriction endonuclease subunit S [Prevotella jejuni]QUB81917.1 restriction endonuclease subunit S [Prevotella jejuni]
MKPKISFKGFKEPWEVSTLRNFFSKVNEKNARMLYSAVLTNSAEYGIIDQRDYFDFDVANSNNISGYYIVQPDDFVYNPRVSVTAPVGPINKNELGYIGVMSPLYLVFKINGINKDYLCHYFKSNKWHKFMRISGNCGARFDRLSISDEQFVQMPIPYPINSKEQQTICNYLEKIDKLISTASSRLASLKQVKEASLQAMFPQKGETVPKIRFKGFEGEWVITKAAEIFKTVNERNFSGLPVLSATQDKGMVTRDSIGYNIFHEKSNESTYKHIVPGQFVMHLRSFQGGFAHSAIEGICSPAYTIMEFKDKEKNHDLYWKYVLTSKRFIKSLEMITYGIRDGRTISFDEFKEMVFLVPKVEEQQQIASYFTSLDKQIALQTQRLEKLKQIKAACLDKMFV